MLDFCETLYPSVSYAYTAIPTYPCGQIGFVICSMDPVSSCLWSRGLLFVSMWVVVWEHVGCCLWACELLFVSMKCLSKTECSIVINCSCQDHGNGSFLSSVFHFHHCISLSSSILFPALHLNFTFVSKFYIYISCSPFISTFLHLYITFHHLYLASIIDI